MNKEDRPEARYKVGDRVMVTSGVKECHFGCNEDMESYIGKVVEIVSVNWERWIKAYEYHFRGDVGHWSWCENCFAEIQTLPEFEVADSIQLSALFT